jgi:hypothetical protein
MAPLPRACAASRFGLAYEYLAEIESGFTLTRLPDLADLAVVLSASDAQILLRWADAPARPDWAEDIVVSRHARGLLVQFHAGRKEQIGEFLQRIADAIGQTGGAPVEFEEA